MKNLLVGNGVNIQFDRNNYTSREIVYRILKNFDREDWPSHVIGFPAYLLKCYLGVLYLIVYDAIDGKYDRFAFGSLAKSLDSFKAQYRNMQETLKMTDIGFEDYYLLHELFCHDHNWGNEKRYHIKKAMTMMYLYAIFNDGKLNELYKMYPRKFVAYLKNYDSIFTTNYDNNVDSVVDIQVYHIHGQFDKLAAEYDENSFQVQLSDSVKKSIVDSKYYYLYSNAISTHCGNYKEFQVNMYHLANDGLKKLVAGYRKNATIKRDVDNWIYDKNEIVAMMGKAVRRMVSNQDLSFEDHYHFEKLAKISGELEILGLSPWNDFHIFETINSLCLSVCVYYYFSESECEKVKVLLHRLNNSGALRFENVENFWRRMDEN